MWSIVPSLVAAALVVAPLSVAYAEEDTPRVLQEPLIGLKYEQRWVQFEPVEPNLLSSCPTLADRESIRSRWFIYAKAEDKSRAAFYVVGGYSVRTRPSPPDLPKFELDSHGVIFSIKDGQCMVFEEEAIRMFEPELAGEIPDEVLQALARDNANRLVAAFGSKAKVEQLLRNQHVAISKLPFALREAYLAILK
ncbi:hypothetical protein GM658_20395 [Pseudoduganella eburnea]|uniref:Uncharacterized protein n=1 Tax=Massilia eburnea TaxID=1776165 RepID=A0A6L6QLD0_9BURK|nr:hypothetical protein [Massilia eburnea]MTW12971.1 hypothetical protein [Massilia eburnea]